MKYALYFLPVTDSVIFEYRAKTVYECKAKMKDLRLRFGYGKSCIQSAYIARRLPKTETYIDILRSTDGLQWRRKLLITVPFTIQGFITLDWSMRLSVRAKYGL